MTKNPLKTDLLSAVDLRLNPMKFNGVYGCMIEFQSDNEAHLVRYKQRFECIGKDRKDNLNFRITRFEDIYINDKKPSVFLHELGHAVSSVLYPLDIECNRMGDFRTVTNFKEIQKRWTDKKASLLAQYKDESVVNYINKASKTLENEHRFLAKMKSDYFLALYFKPIFLYYTASFNFETNLSFPVLGSAKPVNFTVNQRIDEKALERNAYKIHVSGTVNDERSLADLEQKLDYPNYPSESEEDKGSCTITYYLNNAAQFIAGIDGVFDLKFGTSKKVKVKMFLLE
ncbi:hypothetical protein [Maribacter sp. 2-571]|uniref:hypothetical protein n=1 Tax=Maribacter sp. 2-571 TaxID=3417569 RepID=UPI003D34D993